MELTHWKENKEITGSKQDQDFSWEMSFSSRWSSICLVGVNSPNYTLFCFGVDQPARPACQYDALNSWWFWGSSHVGIM